MSESETTPPEYDLTIQQIIDHVDTLEAEAEEARQNLIRERSLALGVTIQKLALTHNGLGDPEVDAAELTDRATQLLGELGLARAIIIPKSNRTTEQLTIDFQNRAEELAALPGLIRANMKREGLSLREVAKRVGCSTKGVESARDGAGSTTMLLRVARALDLWED